MDEHEPPRKMRLVLRFPDRHLEDEQREDGKRQRSIQVGGLSRLYTLLRLPSFRSGLLELRFTPGISAYAFTFG